MDQYFHKWELHREKPNRLPMRNGSIKVSCFKKLLANYDAQAIGNWIF